MKKIKKIISLGAFLMAASFSGYAQQQGVNGSVLTSGDDCDAGTLVCIWIDTSGISGTVNPSYHLQGGIKLDPYTPGIPQHYVSNWGGSGTNPHSLISIDNSQLGLNSIALSMTEFTINNQEVALDPSCTTYSQVGPSPLTNGSYTVKMSGTTTLVSCSWPQQ